MTPTKGYTEMKDSGIHWMGKIPKHWDLIRAKFHFTQTNSRGNEVPILLAASQKYGVCPQSWLEGVVQVSENTDLQQFKTVHKNDFVISLRSFQGGFERSDFEGVCSPAYQVFHADNSFDNNFLKYLFKNELFIDEMNSLTVGIREGRNIKYEDFANSLIFVPPLDEQTAIASYLDAQCAKIDEIIAQAKASIEDYKQWKASIIYEAVTKGLDPNVEMKDSGIPCVDKVPKHWTVTRFGKIAAVKSNLVNPKDYQSYKQISPENIEKGSGVLLDYVTVEESGVISGNHLFYKGQILYSKIRPTLNKVIIAPFDGLCSADMYPIDTDHCSRFILYLMLSAYFNEQVALVTGNRVKMPKINQNELSQIMVAIPSDTEEQQIAKYLDLSCSQIDVLIKEKQSLIDDLESYKKSLIYEVVTGKRRV